MLFRSALHDADLVELDEVVVDEFLQDVLDRHGGDAFGFRSKLLEVYEHHLDYVLLYEYDEHHLAASKTPSVREREGGQRGMEGWRGECRGIGSECRDRGEEVRSL